MGQPLSRAFRSLRRSLSLSLAPATACPNRPPQPPATTTVKEFHACGTRSVEPEAPCSPVPPRQLPRHRTRIGAQLCGSAFAATLKELRREPHLYVICMGEAVRRGPLWHRVHLEESFAVRESTVIIDFVIAPAAENLRRGVPACLHLYG